jgi:hypothetical protein
MAGKELRFIQLLLKSVLQSLGEESSHYEKV